MLYELKYGGGQIAFTLPEGIEADVFEPREATPLADPVAALHGALDAPIGGERLEDMPHPSSVAIAVPDETRPVPLKLLLPPLLERLYKAFPRLKPEDISIVVGGGLHPPADFNQLERIMPDTGQCRVVPHDAEHSPVISFGVTSRGTPVEINAEYAKAELRLVIGMVDAHQFVGFTGGSKGVVVGCASAAMIAANHRMMTDPSAFVGNIDDNPVRQDLNEAGSLAGVHLAINVVMDASKRPVAISAGVPHEVMRSAAARTGSLYGLKFSEPYDIVIASCGGLPKDICLYQAQKGLNTAAQCAAPGGGIILLAKCEQGIGDDAYHNYVRRFKSTADLMADFKASPFRMGAHKAFLFGRASSRFEVVIHSDLADAVLRECLLTPGKIQPTIVQWLDLGRKRVAIIKNANSSFFVKQ